MKLIYFAKNNWEEGHVRPLLPGIDISVYVGALQQHKDVQDDTAEAISVFVDSPVGVAELDRFPNLKLIATRSTGYDHIDMEAVRARGIVVCTVPAYGENTVAEFAFALLLSLTRRVCEAHARVSHEKSFSQTGMEGVDLAGKTMGIVGCGRIGAHAARIAKGFGMQVVVYDVFQNPELATSIGFSYMSLDELLSKADVVSLHIPYMESTHHLINRGNVGLIKKGAYFINTARGAIVETEALVVALKEEKLAGAGLDVLEEEGAMSHGEAAATQNSSVVEANHYLMEHPLVIVTPHIAFDTREALERILGTTAQNILAFIAGTPQNAVK